MTDSPTDFCIYDLSDDCIIAEGTFTQMAYLLDTMAGNVTVCHVDDVPNFRIPKQPHNVS